MSRLGARVGRAVTVVVAALLGAAVTALALPDGASPGAFTAGRPESTRLPDEVLSAARPAPGVAQPLLADPRTSLTAPPRLLRIPRLGLRMPVVPQGVDSAGAMALPATAFSLGWYRFGPGPLDPAGATVLAGHVDTRAEGAGPLAGLAALRPGDLIEVRAGDRSVVYRTTSVTRVSKALVDLPAPFSREGRPRVHLVTCGGRYLPDEGGYQDNVVVAARQVSPG